MGKITSITEGYRNRLQENQNKLFSAYMHHIEQYYEKSSTVKKHAILSKLESATEDIFKEIILGNID